MVRKIIVICFCLLALSNAICITTQAANYSVYDGSFSTTYITYFKDIVSGIGFNENYVAFRSGQYSYTMIVGDIEYDNGSFSLAGVGRAYVFDTGSSSYNNYVTYEVTSIDSLSLNTDNKLIYSDLGDYPELVERGAKYEMLSAVLICIALLSIVIHRILFKR